MLSNLSKVPQGADGRAKIQPSAAPEQMLLHTQPLILKGKNPFAQKKENSIYSTVISPTLRIQTQRQL